MNNLKEQLMRWIDEDREQIIGFLCDFVRAKSPNPPGDTTLAAAHVASFLEAHQLPFRVIAPQPTMPNIVGSFAGPTPSHHLVLNGHMDVFPVDEQNVPAALGEGDPQSRPGAARADDDCVPLLHEGEPTAASRSRRGRSGRR